MVVPDSVLVILLNLAILVNRVKLVNLAVLLKTHGSDDSAQFGALMNMVILKSLECLVNMRILVIS